MTAAYDEPAARVGINRILEKVTAMEPTLAVISCDLKALHGQVSELEDRVRSIEATQFPWKIIGVLAALASVILAAVALLR